MSLPPPREGCVVRWKRAEALPSERGCPVRLKRANEVLARSLWQRASSRGERVYQRKLVRPQKVGCSMRFAGCLPSIRRLIFCFFYDGKTFMFGKGARSDAPLATTGKRRLCDSCRRLFLAFVSEGGLQAEGEGAKRPFTLLKRAAILLQPPPLAPHHCLAHLCAPECPAISSLPLYTLLTPKHRAIHPTPPHLSRPPSPSNYLEPFHTSLDYSHTHSKSQHFPLCAPPCAHSCRARAVAAFPRPAGVPWHVCAAGVPAAAARPQLQPRLGVGRLPVDVHVGGHAAVRGAAICMRLGGRARGHAAVRGVAFWVRLHGVERTVRRAFLPR
eukprot:356891-Chlamydomonas_euryale.AAC.8